MNQQEIPKDPAEQAFETGFVSITVDRARSLLLLEWRRQITLPERKEGFLNALGLTRAYGLTRWLVNDLQLSIITSGEKEWVLTEFQSEASQTTIRRLAVVTPDFYPSLVTNTEFTARGKEGYREKGAIRHEVFPDVASAMEWLLSEEGAEA